jgi:hypothetical protein
MCQDKANFNISECAKIRQICGNNEKVMHFGVFDFADF